jgi:hypothetical protein
LELTRLRDVIGLSTGDVSEMVAAAVGAIGGIVGIALLSF